jgi:hypothetical protein
METNMPFDFASMPAWLSMILGLGGLGLAIWKYRDLTKPGFWFCFGVASFTSYLGGPNFEFERVSGTAFSYSAGPIAAFCFFMGFVLTAKWMIAKYKKNSGE